MYKSLRQPIVCVLGHVDHGKTSILDVIRGTSVAKKEVGGITQKIGAFEVDMESFYRASRTEIGMNKLKIPGLLFIDTPGHVAFSNMRARGGALADIAILVVDINEGFKPQTVESIEILKRFKTPFIVAANKIDLIPFFTNIKNISFRDLQKTQRNEYNEELDKRLYNLVNKFYEFGLSTDRYDRITDFSKTIAIVPVSAKMAIGISDALLMLAGLAQRFLERNIEYVGGLGKGTVIEVKKEESLGLTLDTVLYQGSLKKGDRLAVSTRNGPAVSKVKAIFVSGKGKKLLEKSEVFSAQGIRVVLADKLEVIPGSPAIAIVNDTREAFDEIMKESQINIPLSLNGVTVKAEALGSLEAISYELSKKDIPIRSASIGDITRRDITDVSTLNDILSKIIIGFNVEMLPEAREAALTSDTAVETGSVIYSLIEATEKWIQGKKEEIEEGRKQDTPIPSKFTIMPEYIFRSNKPVIVGVKVLTGRLKVGDSLIKSDGRYAGIIKSIREGETSKKFAEAGQEVAVSIEGVILHRHIFPSETLYVDVPESVVKTLRENNMDTGTMETLEEIIKIKRKENIFWGTRA
ncbi:translation initiation factor IF-2 [Oxyplasma meridianum]|uniref:Translation initiation factor IF-2 n=1 Tax=Oxyplasma meridianum TaxID=3073602 RepID=A0AAX4NGQ8_9ARCH